MSTRSMIAKDYGDKIKAIYCHWDGYPEHNGVLLDVYYDNDSIIDELIELGDISYLDKNVKPKANETHSFEHPAEGVVVAYCRDRGEEKCIREFENLNRLLVNAKDSWCEYVYVWKDNMWSIYKIGEDSYEIL